MSEKIRNEFGVYNTYVDLYTMAKSIADATKPKEVGVYNPIKEKELIDEILEMIGDNSSHKNIKLAKQLAGCGTGEGHDNFLRGIRVSGTLVYPQYFTKQIQRYKFFDIVSSSSVMHTLLKNDSIASMCTKETDEDSIRFIDDLIVGYKKLIESGKNGIVFARLHDSTGSLYSHVVSDLFDEHISKDILGPYKKYNSREELYDAIISNLPSGYMQYMGFNTNYQQLKTIYYQRKTHKLKEWRIFCEWLESLPLFKTLIIK